MKLQLVWDIPTRIFHWALALSITVSVYTGLNGGFEEMDYHLISGYTVLSLVVFRLLWGVLAKGNARFSNFVVGPKRILFYLKKDSTEVAAGHNPLGALSILAILTSLLAQTTTGLFANDDIMVEGPLVHLISEELSGKLTTIHHLNARLIALLIALHLGAVLYQEIVKRNPIVKSMFTGKKLLSLEAEIAHRQQIPLAMLLIVVSSGFVYFLVTHT